MNCPKCNEDMMSMSTHYCSSERSAPRLSDAAACSAWRDPETDPPTQTGKILIWIEGIGPSIVNVEERWMCYWNGNDETEPTAPHEWDWWMEIYPPNRMAFTNPDPFGPENLNPMSPRISQFLTSQLYDARTARNSALATAGT